MSSGAGLRRASKPARYGAQETSSSVHRVVRKRARPGPSSEVERRPSKQQARRHLVVEASDEDEEEEEEEPRYVSLQGTSSSSSTTQEVGVAVAAATSVSVARPTEKDRWETLLLEQKVKDQQLKNLRLATDMLRALEDTFPGNPYSGAFTENEDGTLRRSDGSLITFSPETATKKMIHLKILEIVNNVNSGQIVVDARNPHELMTVWSVTIRIQQLGCVFPPRTTAREKRAAKAAIGKSATRMIKTSLRREPYRVARLVNGVHVPTNAYCTDEELECLDNAIVAHFSSVHDREDEIRSAMRQHSGRIILEEDFSSEDSSE